MLDSSCLFCKIISKTIPAKIEFENDYVIAIHDIAPKAPTHLLIIPKHHVQDIKSLTDSELVYAEKIIAAARDISVKLELPSFNLIANNGREAGQSVFHLHIHLLAGKNLYTGGFAL